MANNCSVVPELRHFFVEKLNYGTFIFLHELAALLPRILLQRKTIQGKALPSNIWKVIINSSLHDFIRKRDISSLGSYQDDRDEYYSSTSHFRQSHGNSDILSRKQP